MIMTSLRVDRISQQMMRSSNEIAAGDTFRVLDEALLPPVNEKKRFLKVFFRRRIVCVSFVLFLLLLVMALFAPLLAPYGYNEQNLHDVLQPASKAHWFGTDALGRDLFSRIIYGSRIAYLVGILTTIIGAGIGTLLGLISGFMGGVVQAVILRLVDAMMAIPNIVLSMLIIAVVGQGVNGVIFAVGISMFPGFIRLVDAQVMSVKQNDYIMAERSMGASIPRILLKHIFPNVTAPLIVMITMTMGGSVMAEAGLSYLGIGITPPTPAWGSLCFDGQQYLRTFPQLAIIPGVMIMLLVFSFNMIGDGLRDALDPRLRGAQD
jgi:ABC-type dipeptide/oligopeptide/nickel transport system permease subunit